MHFFYMDESGDTGPDLENEQQPIFVLAGLSVADKKWNNTKERLDKCLADYFDGKIPDNFELHSSKLLSPNGEGVFEGHDIERRLGLVRNLLGLLGDLGHHVHYFSIDKSRMKEVTSEYVCIFDSKSPYLVSFDYLITYINWHIKRNLGQSARGMLVLDEKKEHHEGIESIIHHRRFVGPANKKVKWIVEFSYPVDSKKNPMIQLSDLVAFCIRRFLEAELGYKPKLPEQVREFYGECFHTISGRVRSKSLIVREGKKFEKLSAYLEAVQAKPSVQWRRAYKFAKYGR
ncbi:hypothetical protein WT60_09455 [Burkholderia sp. MSMB617WGS]|nr:hypothetical protein WT60_09455 [Burkholderia sp. MSMB617WGS]